MVLSEELLQFYDLGYLGIQRLSRPNQHSAIQEKKGQGSEYIISKGMEKSQSKTSSVVMCLGANYADMMEQEIAACGIVNFKIK